MENPIKMDDLGGNTYFWFNTQEISFFGGSKNDIVKLNSAVSLDCQVVFSYTEMVGDGSNDRNGGVR